MGDGGGESRARRNVRDRATVASPLLDADGLHDDDDVRRRRGVGDDDDDDDACNACDVAHRRARDETPPHSMRGW